MSRVIVRLLSAFVCSACLSLSACVFIHSGAISESTGGGAPVRSEFSDYGILYLTAPTDITSNANAALTSQCQSGRLSNVQTELSVRDWFVVQYYTVTTAAVCK